MKKLLLATLKLVWKPALFAALGAFLMIVVAAVMFLNSKDELEIWHTAHLDEEFTERSDVHTLADYLALEDRLFRQLDQEVLEHVTGSEESALNRFSRGSRSDPALWERNWNRTFELTHEAPRAGFLLLHGMSDSPYSMRSLAESLHAAGAWTVGMRMPGHGTTPCGLTSATWEDMAAAVRIGVEHVKKMVGDRPMFLIGYSNGGALSVHYGLSTLEDESLPEVDGMILLSPMIGVTPAAAFAIWQVRVARVLGLEKLKWNSVTAEYDPFKYGSFAVHAGIQTRRLTVEITERFDALRGSEALRGFPPVLAFQSAADATVSAPALISVLMEQLPENGHELVIFDVNRTAQAVDLLAHDPGPKLAELLNATTRTFALSIVTNTSDAERSVLVRSTRPEEQEFEQTPLDLEWPKELYSLSHIALPFPPSDPLYGDGSGTKSPGVQLGNVALRGERGVIRVPPGDMLRIRWNPFFSFVERRLLEFVDLAKH